MKPSDLRLIKDRLLIKPDEAQKKIGLIHIPEKFQEDQETGVVVATGQGRFDNKTGHKVPMQTKVGDRILFNKRQFETVNLESTEYYMLNDSEVLAVLT
jgi:chaperonin GroES